MRGFEIRTVDGGDGGSSDKAAMGRVAGGREWRGPREKRGSKVHELYF